MKTCWIALLVIAFFACQKKSQSPATKGQGSMDVTLGKEKYEPAGKPLAEGAEKFKGRYEAKETPTIRIEIRDFLGKPHLLANNLYLNGRTEGPLGFWYDEGQDALSSRKAEAQTTFDVLKLNPTGDKLLSIHYNWDLNTQDTTVFVRTNH